LPYETRWKTGRSCAKVRATKLRRNFSQPTHPIQTIGHQNISLGSNGVYQVLFGAFRTIWMRLGPFGCLTKLGAKRAERVQKFVPRSRVGIFCNERTLSTPLAPKLMFWCVSYHWVHSEPFGCLTKIGAKRAELVRSCHEVVSDFFATNAPDPTHGTLN
jgi:hypothetical protein